MQRYGDDREGGWEIKPLFIGLNKGFEWLRENCFISLKHRWSQQRCNHQANNGQYID